MQIIPYVFNGGAWSLPDAVLLGIWAKMEQNKLDKQVFYNGSFKSPYQFIEFLRSKQNVAHTVWKDDMPLMIAWLNNWGPNFAFAHFCVMPEGWGELSVSLGKKTVDYWFGLQADGQYILDAILGHTPASNRRAVAYIQKVGLKILGTVPEIKCGGEKCGAVFSYVTREMHNGR